MSKVWRYSVAYHKDGNHILLEHTPFWVVLAEEIVDSPPVRLLHWIPGSWKVFSKIILWLDDKNQNVTQIPVTDETLAVIAADTRWLWDESYVDPDE